MEAERSDARSRDPPEADDSRVEKRPRRDSPTANGDLHPPPPPSYSSSLPRQRGPPPPPPPSHPPENNNNMKRRKVLLANLPYDVTEYEVQTFFESRKLAVDYVKLLGTTGEKKQCNGNAFVYFNDDRDISGAESLDHHSINGRNVRIYEFNGKRTACVRCVRTPYSESDMRRIFRDCDIDAIRLAPQRGHGNPDNVTFFIDFSDDRSFEKALEFDRSEEGLFVCVATNPTVNSSRQPRDGWRRDDRHFRDRDRGGAPRSPPFARSRDVDRYRDAYRGRQDRYNGPDYRGGNTRHRGSDRREFDRDPDFHRNDSRGPGPEHGHEQSFGGDNRNRERFRDDVDYEQSDERSRSRDNHRMGDFDRDRDRNRDRRDSLDGGYRGRDMEHTRHERSAERLRDKDRFSRGRDDFGRRDDNIDRPHRMGGSPSHDRHLSQGPNNMDEPYRSRGRDTERGDTRNRERGWDVENRFREREWDRDRGRDRFRNREREDYRDRRDTRDRYPRDFGRGRGRERDFDRRDSRPQWVTELISLALDDANRFCGDVVEDLTIAISSLHFNDDRAFVNQEIRKAFFNMHPEIKIRFVFPAGRRCGHCFVVFGDSRSRELALRARNLNVFNRSANIHMLDKPYLVRFHKLPINISPEQLSDELKNDFDIGGVKPADDFGDISFYRVENTKDFVRLLAVDGFPHASGRLVSVSYCQGRRPFSAGASHRRMSRDYGDDGRDRGGGGGGGDDYRPGSGSNYRGGGEQPRNNEGNANDRDERGYRDDGNSGTQWRVQLTDLPEGFAKADVYAFLEKNGVAEVNIEIIGARGVVILGQRTGQQTLRNALNMKGSQFVDCSGKVYQGAVYAEEISRKRLDLSNDDDDHGDVSRPSVGMKRSYPGGDELGRASKKTAVSPVDSKKFPFEISPLTPSPSNKDPTKELDPELPRVTERMDVVKEKILGDSQDVDSESFETFCKNLANMRERQELEYTLKYDADMPIPKVWTGGVQLGRGKPAKCDAHLIWRDDQSEREVRWALKHLPEDLNIMHRVDRDDPAFAHLLTTDAVVFMVRVNEKESNDLMSMSKKLHPKPTSRGVLLGALKYLRNNRKVGLVRYMARGADQKVAALCIAPDPEVLNMLRIPWRFRDLIMHDSMLVVVGKKASSDMFKATRAK